MNRLSVLVFLATLVSSCGGGSGGGSPTAPTSVPTANGTYSGTATGSLNLTSFLLTATVADEVITGTLREPEGAGQIPVSGTASSSGAVTMTATDDCGASVYTLSGSIALDAAGGAVMTGTWSQPAAAGCPASSGTFTMTRGGGAAATATFPAGTWVGTLSRPGGDSLSVIWVGTRGAPTIANTVASFDGTATLTYRGVSVPARLSGVLAGSNSAANGYRFNFEVTMAEGAASASPRCSIFTHNQGSITQGLRDSSRTITSDVVEMSYHNCAGFIDRPPCPASGCDPSPRERTQLILNRH